MTSTTVHVPRERADVAKQLAARLIEDGKSFTLVHTEHGIEIQVINININKES